MTAKISHFCTVPAEMCFPLFSKAGSLFSKRKGVGLLGHQIAFWLVKLNTSTPFLCKSCLVLHRLPVGYVWVCIK